MVDRKEGWNKQFKSSVIEKKGGVIGMVVLTMELLFVLTLLVALLGGLVFGITSLIKSNNDGLVSSIFVLVGSQVLWKLYKSILRKVNKS